MAYVKWFQEHTARNAYSKPIEIWCCDLFKPVGPASFLPIVKIQKVCATCNVLINDEVVTAVNLFNYTVCLTYICIICDTMHILTVHRLAMWFLNELISQLTYQ